MVRQTMKLLQQVQELHDNNSPTQQEAQSMSETKRGCSSNECVVAGEPTDLRLIVRIISHEQSILSRHLA
jgi:hypothetical protein